MTPNTPVESPTIRTYSDPGGRYLDRKSAILHRNQYVRAKGSIRITSHPNQCTSLAGEALNPKISCRQSTAGITPANPIRYRGIPIANVTRRLKILVMMLNTSGPTAC